MTSSKALREKQVHSVRRSQRKPLWQERDVQKAREAGEKPGWGGEVSLSIPSSFAAWDEVF